MDGKLIKRLKDAGVGADIILDLILDDEAQIPAAASDESSAAPDPDPTPAAASTASPAPDPVLAKLDSLIGVIQASNIIRAGRESEKTESVDDILASMIAPPRKEG